ncbi:MAG: EAL domain-containing protein, partial [Butyrivibrio sp.]|nr:EAL domain-containing protein [Butyrivibrio sp.]
EALVRLRRPDNENFISPEDFIPVAERCGLIHEIDDLVFEKVCSFIAKENLSSYGIRNVEVNLSGNEVVDRKTHARLIGKMEKYHIPPKFINFEITETAFINNDEAFKDNVQKLKEIGSTFSMDDFGSGYSNLLELLKMDYVMVKMDKEFIWNCLDPDKPENRRMLEYSIGFLKDFGLHVLAEGVETIEQAKTLTEKGVEYLQGFYYSRPLPETEYIEFLKAQKGDRR